MGNRIIVLKLSSYRKVAEGAVLSSRRQSLELGNPNAYLVALVVSLPNL